MKPVGIPVPTGFFARKYLTGGLHEALDGVFG